MAKHHITYIRNAQRTTIRFVSHGFFIIISPCFKLMHNFTAVYGFTPFPARRSLLSYATYFSCAFGIEFDPITAQPKRVSRQFFWKRFKTLGRDFVVASLLISILKQYDYEVFDTKYKAHSTDHSLQDLFSWQHLLNNFLVACEYYY